jgi:hypothetical protein
MLPAGAPDLQRSDQADRLIHEGFETASGLFVVTNNLVTDCGAYGRVAGAAAIQLLLSHNRFDRNTSEASSGADDWIAAQSGWGNNTTSVTQANEYVNAAAQVYNLKATRPARRAGFFPHRDTGALQHQDAGGASGHAYYIGG